MAQLLVKDFAKSLGVTESIIYRHIRNHRADLGDRIIKKSKQTWITDEGQEYIRNLMVQPPTPVLGDSDTVQELADLRKAYSESFRTACDRLTQSNEQLQAALNTTRKDLEAAQQRENELRKQRDKDREAYIEARGRLESAKSEAERKLATAEAERNAAIESRNEARTDLENSTKLNRWLTAAVPAAVAIGAVLCMAIIKIIGG